MNIADFIAKAKKILNEGAGSEGFVYILRCGKPVSAVDNDTVKVSDIKTENGTTTARIEFKINRDYGYALNSLKAVLGDVDVKSLELVY